LIQQALDGTSLHPNADAPAISGLALEQIASLYSKANSAHSRLTRRLPEDLVHALATFTPLTQEILADKAALQNWADDCSQ
ncbi:hypothetical protein GN156_37035, partial [bacterium LRH843]|nr:hypothetical protein [bacterium LRH843]